MIGFRFKLGGAQSVTAEFDERNFSGSHHGHFCMARIPEDKITLVDRQVLIVDRPEGAIGGETGAGCKNLTNASPLSFLLPRSCGA